MGCSSLIKKVQLYAIKDSQELEQHFAGSLFLSGSLISFKVLSIVIFFLWELLEEFSCNFVELRLQLLSNFVLILSFSCFFVSSLLITEALVELELFLTAELTIKDRLHDFLLLGL